MHQFNKSLYRLNNYALVALLVLIPVGFIYRIIQAHALEDGVTSTEWMGIVLMLLIAMEIYLLVHFIWLRLLNNAKVNPVLKLIQLLLIFVVGVLPGLLALYPAFIKS